MQPLETRLVPSRYLIVFWDERRLGIRLRCAQGVMGRKEGKIATGRFRSLETCKCSQRCAGCFFKDDGTFLVFFFLNILCDVYLFIINNKKVSKKYFYAFSGVLVFSPAWLVRGKLRIPGKALAISMVLFIVNCGLKVGNSFLYIFSRFLSFTEILHTFDFLCLCFFYSLTDLFLCASETKKKNNNKEGFYFFRRQGNIYETW